MFEDDELVLMCPKCLKRDCKHLARYFDTAFHYVGRLAQWILIAVIVIVSIAALVWFFWPSGNAVPLSTTNALLAAILFVLIVIAFR